VTIKPIPLSNGYAVLIRIPRSWTSPHRVIFGGHAKFYYRDSSGKHEMDVDELRVAFNLSETLIERVRNFRADRITKILADETPVPLCSPYRIVLHLIPGNAFNPSVKFDINSVYASRHDKLPIIYKTTMNGRYNLDGFFTYSNTDDGKHSAYTQLYRNGIIEAVDALMLAPREREDETRKFIAYPDFEELIKATTRYLILMSELVIEPPIFIFLSLLHVRDFKLILSGGTFPEFSDSIDRDMLLLPAEVIEEHGVRAETVLKPLFDLVWNACGEPASRHYDENGNWRRIR
jgi:hypothetical protein